jgi:hypothetical protein
MWISQSSPVMNPGWRHAADTRAATDIATMPAIATRAHRGVRGGVVLCPGVRSAAGAAVTTPVYARDRTPNQTPWGSPEPVEDPACPLRYN